jgi:hypothetical protein
MSRLATNGTRFWCFCDRERSLRSLALQNICKRCQQKIAWRFQMGKYKAKKPGTRGRCNKCEQKSVRMAYRSLCDACGKAHDLCPGCQHPPSEANASRDVPEARPSSGSESDAESESASDGEES